MTWFVKGIPLPDSSSTSSLDAVTIWLGNGWRSECNALLLNHSEGNVLSGTTAIACLLHVKHSRITDWAF